MGFKKGNTVCIGRKLSQETKKKISEKAKLRIGDKNPFYKKTHTEDAKRRMSIARKGKKLSDETRRRMSESKKGIKIGFRKPPSKEARMKMSKAQKGRHHSLETRRKMSESSRGAKSSQWKGGLTPILERIRTSSKYKQWKQDCLIRNEFTCQKCWQMGGKLHAHHIKPFKELIKEVKEYLPLMDLYDAAMIYVPLWDVENGITLCKVCHKEEHKKRRKK